MFTLITRTGTKLRLIFATCLILALTTGCGEAEKKTQPDPAATPNRPRPETSHNRMSCLDLLTERLEPSPDQISRIKPIAAQWTARRAELIEKAAPMAPEQRAAYLKDRTAELNKNMVEKLRPLLSARQQDRLADLLEELDRIGLDRPAGPPDRTDRSGEPGGSRGPARPGSDHKGAAAGAMAGRPGSGPARLHRPRTADEYMALLTRRLDLSDYQAARIKPVVVARIDSQAGLREAANRLEPEKRAAYVRDRLAAMDKLMTEKISPDLTAGQRDQLKKLLSELNRAEPGGRPERSGPGGDNAGFGGGRGGGPGGFGRPGGGSGDGRGGPGESESARAKVKRPRTVSEYLALFSRRLDLSSDQIAEIKPIVVQRMERQKQLTKAAASLDSSARRELIQKRTAVLDQAMVHMMKSILSPLQRVWLAELLEEISTGSGRGRNGRGGPGGPGGGRGRF